jgi:hypothetical protein
LALHHVFFTPKFNKIIKITINGKIIEKVECGGLVLQM